MPEKTDCDAVFDKIKEYCEVKIRHYEIQNYHSEEEEREHDDMEKVLDFIESHRFNIVNLCVKNRPVVPWLD